MKVLQFPLARITIWFVLGVLFAYYAKPDLQTIFVLLIVSSTACTVAYFAAKRHFLQKLHFGLFSFVLAFAVGAATQFAHTAHHQNNHYIHLCDTETQQHLVEMTVREKLKTTAYSQRYVALIKRIDNKRCSGKILVNVTDPNFNSGIVIGDNLKFRAHIIKHKKPKNPDQFDYGEYLANKSILAQAYIAPSEIQIGSIVNKDIWYYSASLRNRIIDNLAKSDFGKDELAVIAALILGQQQEISAEILQDYQFAGAVHVLSVSGLHVGFIVLFLNFVLKRLPKSKSGNLIRFVLTLLSLWMFAVIAGLSPSVVRSVTMFSFLSAGMYLKRETNIFHTLLVSVLLILVVNPAFLFNVGFQLSYAALFFILWVQPWLSGLWTPKNKVVKYFWDILTVSVAAQIGAFPLSIYYFHQFPGLFFVTNLVILPVLGAIMALGVFVMAMAAFNYVPALPLKVLEWSIYLLNKSISYIASFENLIIQDISLNMALLITVYLSIFAAFLWLQNPGFRRLAALLILVIAVQATYAFTIYSERNNQELIVFHSVKNPLIIERTGRNIRTISGDSTLYNLSSNNLLKSYSTAHFCKSTKKEKLSNLIYFNGNKILVIDSSSVYPNNVKPDAILLTQSPKINLQRVIDILKPKTIIADGTNFKRNVALWRQTCHKKKIPFHATAEKGYYKLD